MQTVSVILFLVLTSANASNYLHPLPPYQQEPRGRQVSGDPFYPQDGYNDEYIQLLLPKLAPDSNSGDELTSVTEPRSDLLQQLLTNRLTESDELRSKRTEASLSIVNALDVLRQRLILELARRRMNESKAQIEKNRVLLIKTGKRSVSNYEDALGEFLLRNGMRNEQLFGKPLLERSTKEDEDRSRKNVQADAGYHT